MEKSKEIISQALNKLEENQDLELKTPKEKVIDYLDKELKSTLKTMENKGLITKIGKIQADIKDLVKDEKNKHQFYKYFEESQVLKILKPLLKENKLTMIISDDDTQPLQWEKEKGISKSGSEITNHYLRYLKKMEISDQETGQTLIYKFWASGDNTDLAKAKGAAETYAMKYILSKFFLIRVVDEDDPELKETNEENKTKTINPAESEKKRIMEKIMEKVILKEDGWYHCKNCGEFRLIKKHPELKLSELKEVLIKHGELT